jgi:hypothetical protein
MDTALYLCQKSIFSSGPAGTCSRAVGAPLTDIQCLPVSELLIINTLATVKPRAELEVEAEAEAESEYFDTFGRWDELVKKKRRSIDGLLKRNFKPTS